MFILLSKFIQKNFWTNFCLRYHIICFFICHLSIFPSKNKIANHKKIYRENVKTLREKKYIYIKNLTNECRLGQM